MMGATQGLIDLSISPAPNKFLLSSFTNLWCLKVRDMVYSQQGANLVLCQLLFLLNV